LCTTPVRHHLFNTLDVPTISRRPSVETATAIIAATETMRPPSRTLRQVASSERTQSSLAQLAASERVRCWLCTGGRWIRTSGSGEREDRVSSLGLLLARDRGVGADVSVQPGFVIIMPSPLEASGAPLYCSPVDPEDDERDQVPTIRAICRTEGLQIFGVDKGAEITVNWSMRFGSVSS
jgi:hypothetical protein